MDRLSPQDASFLYTETRNSPMHIGGVSIFTGPSPTGHELYDAVQRKLALVPRYRQRVLFSPLSIGPPVWSDDVHFDLGYHLRRTALPSPGGEEELAVLTGRVMSQQLDRSKPLWEMWAVEGLSEGRWALLSKVHHSMVDGVSSTDLMTVLLDAAPHPPAAPLPAVWKPAPEPGPARLLLDSAAALASGAIPRAGLRQAIHEPLATATRAIEIANAAIPMLRTLSPGEVTSLNGPVGPHRRWQKASVPLADVQAVRTGLGGTVNDVVLAAVTGGFRALLGSRGELLQGQSLRALVPVSIRPPSARGVYDNQVSAVFAQLPVGTDDVLTRLEDLRHQMDDLKRRKGALAGKMLTGLAGFAPPMLLALAGRLSARLPQRSINTAATNVPGPQAPLYLAGRQMLESAPYVPIAGQIRVTVGIFSYNGTLSFGITGDAETAPDIDVLSRGIGHEIQLLVKLAKGRGLPRARKPEGAT